MADETWKEAADRIRKIPLQKQMDDARKAYQERLANEDLEWVIADGWYEDEDGWVREKPNLQKGDPEQ